MRVATITAILTALFASAVLVADGARAQSREERDALRQEIQALKDGQSAILKELRELRSLLGARQGAAPAAATDITVDTAGAPVLGKRDAPVVLVEFSDFQCPFCARYVHQTFPQIERDYIATGKLRYVMRDFPIESLHAQAPKGHEAARCAGDQGKFWPMHERLFANQRAMSPADLKAHARAVGLDMTAFDRCFDSGRHAAAIRTDLADGQRAGVRGTPSFFVGVAEPNGSKVRVLKFLVGAQPYEQFKSAIDSVLQAAHNSPAR